jgi:hypothetical protein
MQSFLTWIQDLPLSVWVAESDSIWGYAFLLFVHSVGMGLTAGLAFVICLRLLGVGTSIPVSSLRVLFRVFWIGFVLNLVSGGILFMTNATGDARVPVLYIKFLLLGLGVFALSRLRAFIDSERSDGEVPSRIRTTAVACIVLWLGVITAGRLIAYAVESSGASLTPSAPAQIASRR